MANRSKNWSILIRRLGACLAAAFLLSFQVMADQSDGLIGNEESPLPPPTEEQLHRGRELLDKIIFVIDNVQITDAPAVFKIFGFTDLITYEHPTYTYLVPRGKKGGTALPAELTGSGLRAIEVAPVYQPTGKSNSVSARIEMDFSINEACVSISEVRERFMPRANNVKNMPIIRTDRMSRPKRQHDVDFLSFTLSTSPFARRTGAGFTFDYQTCADSFSFYYLRDPGVSQ